MLLASSNLWVQRTSPVKAIIVSRPQSMNHGYPARTVLHFVDSLSTIKLSALYARRFKRPSFLGTKSYNSFFLASIDLRTSKPLQDTSSVLHTK